MFAAYQSKIDKRIDKRQPEGSELRRELRKNIHFTSFVIRHKRLLKSTIVDLSAHGVGLHCQEPLDIDQIVDLTITPDENDYINPIQVRLMVKSCCDLKSGEYRIGGEMANPPSFLAAMFDLAQEEKQEDLASSYAKRVGIKR